MAFDKVGNSIYTDCLKNRRLFRSEHCIGHVFNNCALGRESFGRELEDLLKEELLFVV